MIRRMNHEPVELRIAPGFRNSEERLHRSNPVVGRQDTGTKSSVSRFFINIDAQDALAYLART